MNTKIGTSSGLTLVMVFSVVATMLALGVFGLGKVNAAAPQPTAVTASPGAPGDTATIKLSFEIDEELRGNADEIWVAFDAKYGIPGSITKSAISIASGQTTGGVSNPLIDPTIAEETAAGTGTSPLSVGDTVVKIALGDTEPATTTSIGNLAVNTGQNAHIITFSSAAKITLPTAQSTQWIWMSKDLGITWSNYSDVGVTLVTQLAGRNAVEVEETLTLSSSSGARGKSVTATGKGFTGTGNVTLWIDSTANNIINTDEFVIASDIAVSGGAFEYEFTTDTNFPLTATAINAMGGDGLFVTDNVPTWDAYGSISLDKTEVARGAALKITTVDHLGTPGSTGLISEIKIGSQVQDISEITDLIIATGVDEGFSITVHASTPLGVQKILMTSAGEGARYTTVTITGAPVTVTPSTAVALQEVTVTGTGFTKGGTLATITVGGQAVTNTSSGGLETSVAITTVETDSSGNFSTSFLVPDTTVTRTAGDHKILVTDSGALTGEISVTIPGRTISFSTDSSKRGSEVTVTGTGYEAKGSVALTYLSLTTTTTLGSATADSYGGFTQVVTIPNTPAIPSTNTITGKIGTVGGSQVGTHTIPASVIVIDVAEQETGSNVTITGSGFPAYAAVATMTIGGLDVRPTPAPSTDVDGGFTSTAMVPGLTAGNHTVKVTASDVTGSTSLKVLATTAEVVLVSTATADVFGDIIAADNLVRVWRFDNESQGWSFYDPRPAFASANTMDNTSSGDIVWVNVIAEVSFQDGTLFAGWNLNALN